MKLHILAIAAHPDDIELGCAGTLIKHARLGQPVGILDLTESSLSTRGDIQTRYAEAEEAGKIIGLAVRENAKMQDGFFRNDEEHQRRLITYIRRWQPDIVLANALEDRHPDHGRGGELIRDACFLAGLAKIETVWEGKQQQAWRPKRVFHMIQDRLLEPTFIVDISDAQVAKMEAVRAYRSQFHQKETSEPATYISSENFLKQLEYRDALCGKRIGVEFGEGFVSESIPGISTLDHLLYPILP